MKLSRKILRQQAIKTVMLRYRLAKSRANYGRFNTAFHGLVQRHTESFFCPFTNQPTKTYQSLLKYRCDTVTWYGCDSLCPNLGWMYVRDSHPESAGAEPRSWIGAILMYLQTQKMFSWNLKCLAGSLDLSEAGWLKHFCNPKSSEGIAFGTWLSTAVNPT